MNTSTILLLVHFFFPWNLSPFENMYRFIQLFIKYLFGPMPAIEPAARGTIVSNFLSSGKDRQENSNHHAEREALS